MLKYNLVYFDDQKENIDAFSLLLNKNFNIIGCHDLQDYPVVLQKHRPHGYLVDLHMPVIDGLTLHKKIIESPHYNGCPVFIVSVDLTDESRLKSIEVGAVDFLSRNLNEKELQGRLVSRIKHYLQNSSLLDCGNLRLDFNSFKAYLDETPVELTLLEFRLLGMILRTLPEPIKREELMEKVWSDKDIKRGTLNTHLSNLGIKLWDWDYSFKIKDETVYLIDR